MNNLHSLLQKRMDLFRIPGLFLILVMALVWPGRVQACEIYEVTVEKGECTSNNTYTLTINFLYQDVQSEHFDLWANGSYFGLYAYADLPITITNFPKSGNNNDWIQICDNDNPGCCKTKEFATKDCSNFGDCLIWEVSVSKGECTSDSTYELTVNFLYQNVQGDYFDLWANGAFFGYYAYADLPITIPNFPKSGNNNDWIQICDNDNPDCCKVKEFDTKECGNFSNCEIWDLIVEPHECDNGQFLVDLDFNYGNVGANGFTVMGNGVNYGTFDYNDLPLTLGPLEGNCVTPYEFVVKDVDEPNCKDDVNLGIICCSGDCEIYDLVVEKGDCTSDSTYELWVNFQYQNVNGSHFDLWANGSYFGYYAYADLPLTIPNFPKSGNNVDWIKVCDNDNENCCKVKEFTTKECGNFGDCMIYEVTVTKGECTSDTTYVLTINFLYQNVQSDHFNLYANGSFFGYYAYTDLPLTINNFPKSGGNNDWIQICDNDNPGCCKVKEFDTKECGNNGDCMIYEVSVTKGECTSDSTYVLTINFLFQNVQSDHFNLYVNGSFFGYYAYADLPLTINNFPKSGGNVDWIQICDNDNPGCCKVKEFETKNCENYNGCSIKELEVNVSDCNEDDEFFITFDFQVMNPGNQGFTIQGNGVNYGIFSYDSLPLTLGPLEGNCVTPWEFAIHDVQFPDCQKVHEQGVVCCQEPCEIYDLNVEVGECLSDDSYAVTFDFQVQNPGNSFFEVWTNGDYFGYYPLASLPLTIEFPAGGFNIETLKVCINDQPNCCKIKEFAPPSCLNIPIYSFSVSNDKVSGYEESGSAGFRKNVPPVIEVDPQVRVQVLGTSLRLHVSADPAVQATEIRVMDAVGRQISRTRISGTLTPEGVDVPLPPVAGLAFVQVLTDHGQVVRRIMVP